MVSHAKCVFLYTTNNLTRCLHVHVCVYVDLNAHYSIIFVQELKEIWFPGKVTAAKYNILIYIVHQNVQHSTYIHVYI